MIEGTPGAPYGSKVYLINGIRALDSLECLDLVEKNMNERRDEVRKFLSPSESLLSITFPSLGTPDFTHPPTKINDGQCSESIFFSDDTINLHNKRFYFLHGRRLLDTSH